MNVNKLFRRLSIRTKLVVAFCLFGVVPLAVAGGYGAIHSYLLLTGAVRDRLQHGVVMKAEEIQRFLQGVQEDVRFLSRLPTLQALADLPERAASERRRLARRLGVELLSFSRSHRAYYQIRFLDARGQEVVRADFDGERHFLVAPEQLQDKSDRYYFVEAMATPPGAVYVSPMDLNIERGRVELPHTPVIRFAVPLRSPRDETRGVVIVNLYASRILGQVLTLGKEMGRVSLATSSGEYLSRSEWARPTGEPGFPAGLAFYSDRTRGGGEAPSRPGARLSDEFAPERARAILSGTAATIVEPGLRGRIVAFAPITPRPERPSEFWVLAHTYGKTEVLSSIRSLQALTVALGGGVLAVAFLLGLLAARHFTRPIRDLTSGAEAVARGDFDYRVRVETNDELEDLAQHFTDMATRLRARERDLREARGHAERKAQELQVLLRIGGEILALLSLPEILNLVVDKARELLGADVAILCLATPGGGLRIGAVSGAEETLRETLTLAPGDPVPACACEKVAGPDARCPAAAGAAFATQVAVPMQTGTRGAGSLCVAFVAPRAVGADEREFLSALANLATIAIEKARLHGEVRELTRLEERERIAADLHDGIIQSIYAAGLGLEECVRLAEEAPGEVRRRLDELIDSLNVVIRDVRNYVVGLAPERLQDRDITQALADLARGLSLNGLLDLDLSLSPGIQDLLTPEQARELYQICREALTNVVKHARASRVALSADRTPDGIVVTVQDDGVGFDPRARRAGQGLRNLAERAARLGGDLRLDAAPGRGTRVAIVIPAEVPV